jgi:hypothetical protein
MKSKLYTLIPLFSFVSIFSSCAKWLPENRIEGSWSLTELQKRRAFDNENVSSGLEKGTFTFYENGTASYTDENGSLQGSWQMRNENGPGYTNDNGQRDTRRVLIIRLYNFSNNRVVDWYFNRFDFRSSGSRLFAFIESPNYNYRYCFNKK